MPFYSLFRYDVGISLSLLSFSLENAMNVTGKIKFAMLMMWCALSHSSLYISKVSKHVPFRDFFFYFFLYFSVSISVLFQFSIFTRFLFSIFYFLFSFTLPLNNLFYIQSYSWFLISVGFSLYCFNLCETFHSTVHLSLSIHIFHCDAKFVFFAFTAKRSRRPIHKTLVYRILNFQWCPYISVLQHQSVFKYFKRISMEHENVSRFVNQFF